MRSPPTRGGWGGLFGEKGRPRLSFWDTLGAAARDGGGFWVRKRCHGCHGSQHARQRVRVRLFQPSLFSVVSGREGLKGVDVTPPVSICLPETRSESHWRGGLSNISSVSADESRRSWECVCTRVWSVFVKTLPLVYSGWSSGSGRRRKTEAQHPDTACIFYWTKAVQPVNTLTHCEAHRHTHTQPCDYGCVSVQRFDRLLCARPLVVGLWLQGNESPGVKQIHKHKRPACRLDRLFTGQTVHSPSSPNLRLKHKYWPKMIRQKFRDLPPITSSHRFNQTSKDLSEPIDTLKE